MFKKIREKAFREGHTNNIWNAYGFVMCGLGEKSRIFAKIKHIRRCIKWSTIIDNDREIHIASAEDLYDYLTSNTR